MKSRTTTTPPDFDAMYNAVLGQMGGPVELETPQLGRVAFPRPSEMVVALNYLKMAQNAAAGNAPTGVIVIGHDRGLWPPEGCC
jgi:hypothetical protein